MFQNLPPIADFSFATDLGYPRQVCSAIMTKGCNLSCGYCFNRNIIKIDDGNKDPNAFLLKLKIRKERICLVSGGEPFIHKDIFNLFSVIKSLGMEVAVSTNGTYPDKMREAFSSGLVDRFILDIKSRIDYEKYKAVCGGRLTSTQFDHIVESIDFMKGDGFISPSGEFRTTVCSKFVSKEDVLSIAQYIGKNNIYILQQFNPKQTLDVGVSNEDFVVEYQEMKSWLPDIQQLVFKTFIRDI